MEIAMLNVEDRADRSVDAAAWGAQREICLRAGVDEQGHPRRPPFPTVTIAYRIDGPVDMAALVTAINLLVERTDVLHTRLRRSGDRFVLVPDASWAGVPVVTVDLGRAPGQGRRLRHLTGDLRRGLNDMQEGPLGTVLVARLHEHEHILCAMFDHSVMDHYGIMAWMRRLGRTYGRLATGDVPGAEQTARPDVDFLPFVREQLADTAERTASREFWEPLARTFTPLEMPGCRWRPWREIRADKRHVHDFPPDFIQALASVCQLTGGSRPLAFLGALTLVIAGSAGTEFAPITYLRHGHEVDRPAPIGPLYETLITCSPGPATGPVATWMTDFITVNRTAPFMRGWALPDFGGLDTTMELRRFTVNAPFPEGGRLPFGSLRAVPLSLREAFPPEPAPVKHNTGIRLFAGSWREMSATIHHDPDDLPDGIALFEAVGAVLREIAERPLAAVAAIMARGADEMADAQIRNAARAEPSRSSWAMSRVGNPKPSARGATHDVSQARPQRPDNQRDRRPPDEASCPDVPTESTHRFGGDMPADLHWLPVSEYRRVIDGIADRHDRARAFAALNRINTLYMIGRAGSGHLGSSFSAADLVAWLLLEELDEDRGDVFFSSKGHDAPGLYAALIGTGRLDQDLVHRLRRLDGLPGHPDVNTPHMPFNTGSLGMGISKAKGLVLGNRLAGRRPRIVVLTGDGELQEGQNWESLAGGVHHHMSELTVVVDHNKIQSDTWVSSVSDLGDLAAKFSAFGWGVTRCDGNDPAAIEIALAERHQRWPDRPAVLIADTVKGAGCATFAATSMPPTAWRYRFHSGAPSAEDHGCAYAEMLSAANELLARYGLAPLRPEAVTALRVSLPAGPKLPEIYGHALAEAATTDNRIVALDADLMVDTGLMPFVEAHPTRFFECGIAEQDMVSIAGGLAASNLVPFVHSFSCFLHARPNEQIYNNATEKRKIVYVASLAGLLPAGPGHSHQGVRDISALGAIPGLIMLEPAGPEETRAAVDYCRTTGDSVYLRLVSLSCSPEMTTLPAAPLVTGHGSMIRPGGPVLAIGSGPVILTELLRAAEQLGPDGIDLTVLNLPWLNRVDRLWLADCVAGASHIFVVQNQYDHGGQADMLARAILELPGGRPPVFRGIGLDEIPVCGSADEALAAHGLRADQLAKVIRKEVAVNHTR
ncbi:1-deoxy-D-xylulose-5-phosphate synthase N-terminal domain-containing protein [Micromonospora sp. NPDC049240]|uniref:1-deoxy-D-xylulose-5-phosphate synthase N-terminal domain-containing protein n=1 Tax=Micromonospora sp. NPDC049240 TaxID=3155151 RepID=UPI0033EEB4E5